MLTIELICVSKTRAPGIEIALADYLPRLKHVCRFNLVAVREEKVLDEVHRDLEVARLREKRNPRALHIALDERGAEMTSAEFAKWIERYRDSARDLQFFVGGPLGLGPAFREECHQVMSLTKMTLPHDLVRLLFVEQLYRGFSILAGSAYHKV